MREFQASRDRSVCRAPRLRGEIPRIRLEAIAVPPCVRPAARWKLLCPSELQRRADCRRARASRRTYSFSCTGADADRPWVGHSSRRPSRPPSPRPRSCRCASPGGWRRRRRNGSFCPMPRAGSTAAACRSGSTARRRVRHGRGNPQESARGDVAPPATAPGAARQATATYTFDARPDGRPAAVPFRPQAFNDVSLRLISPTRSNVEILVLRHVVDDQSAPFEDRSEKLDAVEAHHRAVAILSRVRFGKKERDRMNEPDAARRTSKVHLTAKCAVRLLWFIAQRGPPTP
jgi:hypothetical protein